MLINEIHARHQRITQHIGFGLMPSPFGTLLPEKSGHPRYSLFFRLDSVADHRITHMAR